MHFQPDANYRPILFYKKTFIIFLKKNMHRPKSVHAVIKTTLLVKRLLFCSRLAQQFFINY